MSHSTRRKSRSIALQVLYQMDVSNLSAEDALRRYWAELDEGDHERDYTESLVHGVASSLADLDKLIESVSEHWRMERMSVVDRNLLRLAAYELQAPAGVPARVVLNEAIELAKLFGAEDSAAFVNGLLDRIARQLAGE